MSNMNFSFPIQFRMCVYNFPLSYVVWASLLGFPPPVSCNYFFFSFLSCVYICLSHEHILHTCAYGPNLLPTTWAAINPVSMAHFTLTTMARRNVHLGLYICKSSEVVVSKSGQNWVELSANWTHSSTLDIWRCKVNRVCVCVREWERERKKERVCVRECVRKRQTNRKKVREAFAGIT